MQKIKFSIVIYFSKNLVYFFKKFSIKKFHFYIFQKNLVLKNLFYIIFKKFSIKKFQKIFKDYFSKNLVLKNFIFIFFKKFSIKKYQKIFKDYFTKLKVCHLMTRCFWQNLIIILYRYLKNNTKPLTNIYIIKKQ